MPPNDAPLIEVTFANLDQKNILYGKLTFV